MNLDLMTLQASAALAFATLIRSTFGFGEALIAVPLLCLIMPVEVAVPTAALVSITVAAIILLQDWSEVDVQSAKWLVLSTLPGVPLGLLLLTHLSEQIVKLGLAAIIISFSTYSLWRKKQYVLKSDRLVWIFGFFAGILGGAYSMNGPPLVIYGALRRWSPQHFRATLQGYFLPASVMVMCGYWMAGLWSSEVIHYYLLSLPVVVAATFLGRLLNRGMSGSHFLLYIHVGLILIGFLLLAQAVG